MGDDRDRYYLDLKGARERLCRAQTHTPAQVDRNHLQTAITMIDLVGSELPQWSEHDRPVPPPDPEGDQ